MSDQTPDHPAVSRPNAEGAPPVRGGWRRRALALRGVVAVALASLLIGGTGGAVLGVAAGGSDDGRSGGPGGPGGFRGRPPVQQGTFPGQPSDDGPADAPGSPGDPTSPPDASTDPVPTTPTTTTGAPTTGATTTGATTTGD
ncbi:hypothetical protein [Nocardioides kribbensis]|uniref:hypothetical protein n=1 Tax=Nocardioides kribbensis TaxID=305517 RepID=UPI00187A783C|nr:hypothetical protein [Nocardioides kribbensis]